jgi:hypothetical protein
LVAEIRRAWFPVFLVSLLGFAHRILMIQKNLQRKKGSATLVLPFGVEGLCPTPQHTTIKINHAVCKNERSRLNANDIIVFLFFISAHMLHQKVKRARSNFALFLRITESSWRQQKQLPIQQQQSSHHFRVLQQLERMNRLH